MYILFFFTLAFIAIIGYYTKWFQQKPKQEDEKILITTGILYAVVLLTYLLPKSKSKPKVIRLQQLGKRILISRRMK